MSPLLELSSSRPGRLLSTPRCPSRFADVQCFFPSQRQSRCSVRQAGVVGSLSFHSFFKSPQHLPVFNRGFSHATAELLDCQTTSDRSALMWVSNPTKCVCSSHVRIQFCFVEHIMMFHTQRPSHIRDTCRPFESSQNYRDCSAHEFHLISSFLLIFTSRPDCNSRMVYIIMV